MKYKTFSSLKALVSVFLLQFLLLHALASASNGNRKASALEFFKQFRGSQKGDKVRGIHALKNYLRSLGYLDDVNNNPSKTTLHNSHSQPQIHDDYFDENLESAIKTYQINFNLNPTGTIDLNTILLLSQPRCGMPDQIKGVTRMRSAAGYNFNISGNFHSHFATFPGQPKWPAGKQRITFGIEPGTRPDVRDAVSAAFATWSSVTPFKYDFVEDYNTADVKISFRKGDHGDGYPFDGPGPVVAHAFAPTDGRLHFDADNNFAVGSVAGAVDIQTVALHEIGHILGLAHTSVEAAIMWPSVPNGGTKRGLNDDDIQGIRALYG